MKHIDLSRLELTHMPIGEIRAYERNPREHPETQIRMLEKSITRFGFNAPVLVAPDHMLIAGHGRLEAARRLGMTHLPAITLPHLTEAKQRAYRIADNAITLRGSWSLDLLAAEFEVISELDVDFDPMEIGFETAEFDGVLAQAAGRKEKEPEEVPLPDRDRPAITRPGDFWSTDVTPFFPPAGIRAGRLFCASARLKQWAA